MISFSSRRSWSWLGCVLPLLALVISWTGGVRRQRIVTALTVRDADNHGSTSAMTKTRTTRKLQTTSTTSSIKKYNLRWAASGGGWRAMVTQMGFANLFAQVGLMNSTYCQFSAISANSGGSWFATQFFYAPNYFDKVINEDTNELRDLIVDWMKAYETILAPIPNNSAITTLAPSLNMTAATLYTLKMYNGSWADFIYAMFTATSTAAYDDPTFANRTANVTNRVPALSEADLLIQIVLSPTAVWKNMTSLSYMGPSTASTAMNNNNNNLPVYATPLSVAYVVNNSQTQYRYNLESDALPLSVQWSDAPSTFRMRDWEPYYLYPNLNGSIYTQPLSNDTSSNTIGTMNPFFGNAVPTVTQISSASSTAGGALSSTNPSMLAQALSLSLEGQTTTKGKLGVELLGRFIYSTSISQDIAVCSQWPSTCGEFDARLVDGGYVDNNALVVNVAEYHSKPNADLNQTLKIILTSANLVGSFSHVTLFSYFSNEFNQHVAPGDFVWPVALSTQLASSLNPIRSPQIFEEYMADGILNPLRTPVLGTNLTTARLSGTTVSNPAYGIGAGQRVDILYLEINSMIPTVMLGVNDTQTYTPALVDLALDIASVGRDDLLDRINAFLHDDNGGENSPTETPTSSSSAQTAAHFSLVQYVILFTMTMVLMDLPNAVSC